MSFELDSPRSAALSFSNVKAVTVFGGTEPDCRKKWGQQQPVTTLGKSSWIRQEKIASESWQSCDYRFRIGSPSVIIPADCQQIQRNRVRPCQSN
jgi:hypothetical protein